MWPFKSKEDKEKKERKELMQELPIPKDELETRSDKIKRAGGSLKSGYGKAKEGYNKLEEKKPFIEKIITCLLTLIFVGLAFVSKVFTKDFADPWPEIIFFILLMATPWLLIGIFIKNIKFKWVLRGLIIVLILYLVVTSFSSFISANSPIGKTINQVKSFPGNAICSLSFITHGQFEDIYSCWMEEEKQVEKEGTYETLNIMMGVRRTSLGEIKNCIKPLLGEDYDDYNIILKNDNEDLDILLKSIVVSVAPKNYFESPEKFIEEKIIPVSVEVEMVSNRIKAGVSRSVPVEFKNENRIPFWDTRYIHFHASIISEQTGGGVSKMLFVPQYSGFEDIVDLFESQPTTRAGPIDVDIRTKPRVILLDKTEEFTIKIKFYNERDGIASLKKITIYQTLENVDENIIEKIECENYDAEIIDCPQNKIGNCLEINLPEEIYVLLEEDITCKAIVNKGFSLENELETRISADVEYEYIQEKTQVMKLESS